MDILSSNLSMDLYHKTFYSCNWFYAK